MNRAIPDLRLPAVVAVSVLVTVAVPLAVPADGGPAGVDRVLEGGLHRACERHPDLFRALVIPSNGYVLIPLLVLGVLWYARRGDRFAAGFLLLAPELAVAINTWALKPLWHRHLHHYLAYPSGHTVQFVAIATGFVLVAPGRRARIAVTVVAVVVLAPVAAGMVGLGYHHPTDILGGAAAGVALVTAMYLGADRWPARRRR
ncbi:phosphatase PAP2 family protein [Nocardia sp. alder85J]|uniref:phosphatase PAP2 family protein n=1 Tax=Nocardia sp. alder85J TaxID=2862949 RepID=UPI001CD68AF0|nr:phosphatase PAP2 family protein [Nocardia sp. alder85J]MCX4092640.1 phosphatase PAP2 family protein [Nocardia sp. alder85J]